MNHDINEAQEAKADAHDQDVGIGWLRWSVAKIVGASADHSISINQAFVRSLHPTSAKEHNCKMKNGDINTYNP